MGYPSTRGTVVAAMLAACVLAGSPAQGQAPYPSQAIRLMVPNPAGGLPDTVARIIGRRLQERFSQSVVIENRPGANARVAVAALMNTPADGHTLLVTDGAILSINPLLYTNLTYDPKDVLPIVLLARALGARVVTNDFNLNKVAQLRGVEAAGRAGSGAL